jgi:uncharacterized membrane protein YeaQ/YmgE (transglycosylase-associated protein family)
MSKKVGFPVMSASITGYLYILALVLGSLTLLVTGLGLGTTGALVNALLFFIGALFAGWAMLSYALHPALDSNQRLIATIFAAILLLVYFNAGVSFALTF